MQYYQYWPVGLCYVTVQCYIMEDLYVKKHKYIQPRAIEIILVHFQSTMGYAMTLVQLISIMMLHGSLGEQRMKDFISFLQFKFMNVLLGQC